MARSGRLDVLSPAECQQLMRSRSIGRVAVNRRGLGPLVVPVNYAVDESGAVVFRTGEGTKLARIAHGAVSFQVDGFDEKNRTGWSVLVAGLAHEVDACTSTAAEVDPWVSSPTHRAVRIVPTTVTGRWLR
jgi:nitroimidazol reductase NimA-like FMN-containing flavoprotein (pyridoxamine 5'-phosphate oxidase superfamily)